MSAELIMLQGIQEAEAYCTNKNLWVTGKKSERACVKEVGAMNAGTPYLLSILDEELKNFTAEERIEWACLLRDLVVFFPCNWKSLGPLKRWQKTYMKIAANIDATHTQVSICQIVKLVNSIHTFLFGVRTKKRNGLAGQCVFQEKFQPLVAEWIESHNAEKWDFDLTNVLIFTKKCELLHKGKVDISEQRILDFVRHWRG